METPQATQLRIYVGWAFWFRWVLANALALTISVEASRYYPVVNAALGKTLGQSAVATTMAVLSFLSGILIAILVGMLQWLVLRRYVRWAKQWWIATSVGWIVGSFIASYAAFPILAAHPLTVSLTIDAVTLTVMMGVVGVFQWLVLRRHVRRAGWWVLASIAGPLIAESVGIYAGFYVAMFAGGILAGLSQDLAGIVFLAFFTAAIGAIAGSVTGFAFVQLLRRSPQEA